jgi:hypothetical protein
LSAFIDFWCNSSPANVKLFSFVIDGECRQFCITHRGIFRLLDLYKSTLHSLTGSIIAKMIVNILPVIALYPNISILEMNYPTRDQYIIDMIQFFELCTERKRKIQMSLNVMARDKSMMIKLLESLPSYDDCSVKLCLHDSPPDLAHFQSNEYEFTDLVQWLGAVEQLIIDKYKTLAAQSCKMLFMWLQNMPRLRTLRISSLPHKELFPFEDDDHSLSDLFFHWLFLESPASISVYLELRCENVLPRDNIPAFLTSHIGAAVAKLNEKYTEYNVCFEHECDDDGFVRGCLKIENGDMRQLLFDLCL